MDETVLSRLIAAARSARNHAYAPYSNFCVGAAILCKSGRIVTAANVENASFGLSICAECLAVAQAVAEGERDFLAMAIATTSDGGQFPCGACCQVLAEFCNPDFVVYADGKRGTNEAKTLRSLAPTPFKFESDTCSEGRM